MILIVFLIGLTTNVILSFPSLNNLKDAAKSVDKDINSIIVIPTI